MDDKIDILYKIEPFNRLEIKDIEKIEKYIDVITYKKDEYIFKEGNTGEYIYIVVSGELEVFQHAANSAFKINHLKKGDFFGEMAVLDGKARSADVRCLKDSILFTINKNNFKKIIMEYPEISWEILRYDSARMRNIMKELKSQLEARLVSAEEYSDIIISSMINSLIVISPSENILGVNAAACDLLGYTVQELVGKPLSIIFPDNIYSKISMLFKKEDNKKNIESVYADKNGKKIPVLVSWSAIRNKDNSIQGFILVAQDISELKVIQEELIQAKKDAEQASKAKSDFLAVMSHEFRTPLNAIIGMTELLSYTELNNKQYDFLESINISGKTLLRLINDILDFSKIEAGKLKIENIPFNLLETLKNTVSLFQQRANDKGLNLSLNIDNEIPEFIYGDQIRLKQILINLIDNSIKFTDEGYIKVSAGIKDKKYLLFSVKDSGAGISEDKRDIIFDTFTQLDNSVTRNYGGTGLGLAICKKLVNLMNGKIWIESLEDYGTTFFFQLPFKEAKPVKKTEPDRKAKYIRIADDIPMKILVVEDNPMNVKLMKEVLNFLGYEPNFAENGIEALELVRTKKYDIIFMDIQMPKMDGITAAKEIIKNIGKDRPIIIALTAHSINEGSDLIKESIFDDFLEKPLTLNNIKEKMTKFYRKN